MRRNYDEVDPAQYDARHDKVPRESYLHNHWYPLTAATISKYCEAKLVLDLGCGTGTYTRIIAKHGHVVGLDISKVMLSYAKSKHPDLSLALADAHHIPLRVESIDTAVCIGLFEYVERAMVFKEINRVLKPDGVCIIQCPNKYSAVRIPAKVICKLTRREYFAKEPSYGEMLKLFKQYGFKVIEWGMDDGLIWLPSFLDRLCGRRIYSTLERFFKVFGRNPFSNVMLFVANLSSEKGG